MLIVGLIFCFGQQEVGGIELGLLFQIPLNCGMIFI